MKPKDLQSSSLELPDSQLQARCDAAAPGDYLLCVTVHKANYTTLQNADTFIELSLDQHWHKRTTIADNTDTPFFNEYFVFELHEQLDIVLRRTLRVAAYVKTCCAKRNECIGEFRIDVQTVWLMKGNNSFKCYVSILENWCETFSEHGFTKKWVSLTRCSEPSDPVGYLQLDLCVMSKGLRPRPAEVRIEDCDNIEE